TDPSAGQRRSDLRQRAGPARVNPPRRAARARKLGDQRHREAAGMGGADELFGIRGGFTVFEPGLERVRSLKGTAAHGEASAALDQIAFPFCFGCAAWHTTSSVRDPLA